MVEERLTWAEQEGSGLDLSEVEDIVKTAAQDVGGLSISSDKDAGYIRIFIGPPSGDPESVSGDPQVRIWTSGTEAFFIDVPGGFGYQEFDDVPEGQVATLHLLVTLASRYLHGHFEEKEEQRSFGRRRRYLEISSRNEVYRLYQR
ncbi:hypothetical protein GTR02_04345 [Kineococcus sp. R8]|uniref:hypothetical protein n=1 Tax=Kineococcus siccus TaxID=2696567 RepID=UPI001412050D|nr:hypothetical protein [Kineococcus siccus]NAZ81044.1 hypothetical protein [Kineococcus siccus]